MESDEVIHSHTDPGAEYPTLCYPQSNFLLLSYFCAQLSGNTIPDGFGGQNKDQEVFCIPIVNPFPPPNHWI